MNDCDHCGCRRGIERNEKDIQTISQTEIIRIWDAINDVQNKIEKAIDRVIKDNIDPVTSKMNRYNYLAIGTILSVIGGIIIILVTGGPK